MTMVRQRKTSLTTQSTAGSTPFHPYNTRLQSERQFRSSRQLKFTNASGDHNEDTYLLEDRNSDRFSVASSNCFKESSHNLLEWEDRSSCVVSPLVKLQKGMDFDGCPPDNRLRWIRNGGIVLIAAVIGWYVNHVRMQLRTITADVESVNGRITDIVDARLDTLYQLNEVNSMVKELRQSQDNFKVIIKEMIGHEIDKMYSDKTGRTDFALESAGGRIVKLSQGTENYGQPKSSLLGISLCEGMHGPRAMIQSDTSPGQCWAFKGSSGGVIVKLLGPIKINAISMEHISKTISPSGDSKTAPKDFSVWGMKSATDRGMLLGQFTYDVEGPLVQTFTVQNPSSTETYDFVELRVMSNHGHPDFTCIYRFRVHGAMDTTTK